MTEHLGRLGKTLWDLGRIREALGEWGEWRRLRDT